MARETDQERLDRLIAARHAAVSITTVEEDYALGLVRNAAINLGRSLRLWSMVGGVRDGLVADVPPIPETEHPAAGLYYFGQHLSEPTVLATLDLVGHLRDERTLRLLRELIARTARSGNTLVMIDHSATLPPVIAGLATAFELTLPDEEELDAILRDTLRVLHQEKPIQVKIPRPTFANIVKNLRGLSRRQAQQVIVDCVCEDRQFNDADLETVLARKRQMLSATGLLEHIETPATLEEIGGLRNLKRWLHQREQVWSEKAKSFGLKAPRGVLLLGVQGAGKSLCAKAIATGWRKPLLRMDVGALYDRYIGESERRLRDTLRQAEAMAPNVLWIDEIEKAFASAASRSIDGGLSQRMFAALLTWMQEHQASVFMVATANDIEALPPELLRKGRFDEIFFVDLPGREAREQIFTIHLRKRGRDPRGFDMDKLADQSAGFTGAEIEQAVISAMHNAFAEGAELDTGRVLAALKNSPPLSVIMADRVEALRKWAAARCVPAD